MVVTYRVGERDPNQFIADAMALGISGVITEQLLPCPLPQCVVADMDLALAQVSAVQLEHPDRKLLTIGVTGSAGKTTTSLLIAGMLKSAGILAAYQTDLGSGDGLQQNAPESPVPAGESLVHWFQNVVNNKCPVAIVELDDERLNYGYYDHVRWDLLVVTGSGSVPDHFGPSSLQSALDQLDTEGVVIVSADEPRLERTVRDAGVRMLTYGVRKEADITAKIIDQTTGMTTLLLGCNDTSVVMETTLCGGAMAACHCAAAAVGILLERPLESIAGGLSRVHMLPGRMQSIVAFSEPAVYLDIAGSPKRLTSALRAARGMRNGNLWCVLALSGNETIDELAEYGRSLERFSKHVVLTCRPEAKLRFLELSHAVLDGVQDCAAMRWVADWKQAIQWVTKKARVNDTILVAGGVNRQTPLVQRRDLETLQSWIQSGIKARGTTENFSPTLRVVRASDED
jgi:UDP-N-acetylmuramoyl-L-alanyl-D-glutamate--2,6-diaminopimelate ligase